MITVKIGKVPGSISEVALNDGATADDAARQAGLDTSGHTVRVNGSEAAGTTRLNDGDRVLYVAQVKGA